jgi:hypothetical protein
LSTGTCGGKGQGLKSPGHEMSIAGCGDVASRNELHRRNRYGGFGEEEAGETRLHS